MVTILSGYKHLLMPFVLPTLPTHQTLIVSHKLPVRRSAILATDGFLVFAYRLYSRLNWHCYSMQCV